LLRAKKSQQKIVRWVELIAAPIEINLHRIGLIAKGVDSDLVEVERAHIERTYFSPVRTQRTEPTNIFQSKR
jgi:hypothetical protein